MENKWIFKTDIQGQNDADRILKVLRTLLPDTKIDFAEHNSDLSLKIEGCLVDADLIISEVEKLGFYCEQIRDEVNIGGANSAVDMREFWDDNFIKHKTMWGFEPSQSVILAKDLFIEQEIKDILIPGIGYGRNAQIFIENNIKVTGIEISESAIQLAREYYKNTMQIFQGSVTEMPLDHHLYDGIFCYALLHLLNNDQRKKMINDCYEQLRDGGWMIFSVISKHSPNYGKGRQIGKDTFEIGKGGQLFFYDMDAVQNEFKNYGLVDYFEIDEQTNPVTKKSAFKFIMIICRKDNNNESVKNESDCKPSNISVIFNKMLSYNY
jgi:SAM-dependent methyltransferase